MRKFLKKGCLIYLILSFIITMIGGLFSLNTNNSEISYNITESVNFRSEASLESEVLKVLIKDETVVVLDSVNNWYKVKDDNKLIGFVSKNYLNKNILETEQNSLISYLFILLILAFWLLYKVYKTKCTYCEKRCLIFTKSHKNCRLKYAEATDLIEKEVEEYFNRFSEDNFIEVDEVYTDKELENLKSLQKNRLLIFI